MALVECDVGHYPLDWLGERLTRTGQSTTRADTRICLLICYPFSPWDDDRRTVIDVIIEHAFSCSSPRSYVAMFHLKGAVSRVAEGETAFGNRQASHAITLDGVWRPREDFGDGDTAWARGFFAALGRFREGVYVNFLGGDEDPDRVREAYGDSVYDRLVDVKTTYDPDNVFRHNQNIHPRATTSISRPVAGSG